MVVRPPGAAWHGPAASESERRGLRLELEGGYGSEVFPELGRGVWLGPVARLRITIDEPGRLRLRIAAPRPTPADPRLVVGGKVVAGPFVVDHRETTIGVRVDDEAVARGYLDFEVVSESYRPTSDGGADTRKLGVVLLGLEFEPDQPSGGWWNVR